jgi:hypothetical protein
MGMTINKVSNRLLLGTQIKDPAPLSPTFLPNAMPVSDAVKEPISALQNGDIYGLT